MARHDGVVAAAALILLGTGACSDGGGGGGWIPGPDASAPDGSADAAPDTTSDAEPDAMPDAGPDAVADASPDVPPDVPDGSDTADGDATPDPGCDDRVHLTASGALDLDAQVVSVSGTLTRNGAPFAPKPGASVRFTSPRGALTLPLEGAAAASFSGEVFAGSYDVAYLPPPACDPEDTPVPCQQVRVAEAVALTSSGSLDLDLHVVALSGSVRLEGAAIPAGPHPRGAVDLEGEHAGPVSFPLEGDAGATWSGEVFADPAYDLTWRPGEGCSDETPLPCHPHRALEDVPVAAPGALDVDLDVVEVAGLVRLEGAPVTDGDAGAVSFADGAGSIAFALEPDGTYGGRVFAGTYDVTWASGAGCADGPLPCQSRLVFDDQPLTQDGVLDLDLEAVEVTGSLTVNGATPAGARGEIVLAGDAGEASDALEPDGAATWETRVFPGTYAVRYEPAAGCDPDEDTLPCHAHRLRAALALTADGSLDLDAHVVDVAGTLTLHGAAMPADPRGTLAWRDAEGGALGVPVADSGPATWSARLFAGTFEVAWLPPEPCPGEDGPLPCQPRVLRDAQEVSGAGALDLDLGPVEVTGALTRNGAALSGEAGSLAFEAPGGAAAFPVHADEGGVYGGAIFPGDYEVRYTPPASCDEASGLPCGPWLLRGCPAAP